MKLDVSTEDVCTMFMEGHNFVKISTKFILLHEMYGTSGTVFHVHGIGYLLFPDVVPTMVVDVGR